MEKPGGGGSVEVAREKGRVEAKERRRKWSEGFEAGPDVQRVCKAPPPKVQGSLRPIWSNMWE